MAHKFGHIIGDIGGKSGFAHCRTSGNDDEVGIVESAGFFVESIKAGRKAGYFAVFLIGLFDLSEGRRERFGKVDESALAFTLVRQFEKFLFCSFYLGGRIGIQVFFHGVADDFVTGVYQFAAQVFVINELCVIFDVSQRRSAVGKFYQILVAADFVQGAFLFKIVFERDDVRNMTALNQFGNDFENLGVNRIGKVVGTQEFGNFFIGFVVGQNGAEQSLFGFQVLRQRSGVDLFHRGRLSCEKN